MKELLSFVEANKLQLCFHSRSRTQSMRVGGFPQFTVKGYHILLAYNQMNFIIFIFKTLILLYGMLILYF